MKASINQNTSAINQDGCRGMAMVEVNVKLPIKSYFRISKCWNQIEMGSQSTVENMAPACARSR